MTDIQITRLSDLPNRPPSKIESAATLAIVASDGIDLPGIVSPTGRGAQLTRKKRRIEP